MNLEWFGDSYDIVKRHFADILRGLGYNVYVDPMPTGEWSATETDFLRFIGAKHVREFQESAQSALLLDPDTGVGAKKSPRHTTIQEIAGLLEIHAVVFVFDQSFSRGTAPLPQLVDKLRQLRDHGAVGFYYDSHARFLFASRSSARLNTLRNALLTAGLPHRRIIDLDGFDA